jgi:hypothetical protein
LYGKSEREESLGRFGSRWKIWNVAGNFLIIRVIIKFSTSTLLYGVRQSLVS